MQKKELIVHVKGIDAERRTITAYGNTETPDRDREMIRASAFKNSLDAYMKNPVIIAGHVYNTPNARPTVIGQTLWANTDDKGLLFSMRFANTELASEYWDLYREGFMRAFSVGFIPKTWIDKTPQNASMFPPGVSRIHEEGELLEISAVPIPSERRSLVLAASAGNRLAESLLESSGDEIPLEWAEAILSRLNQLDRSLLA